jgi:hypothetical protein
MSKVTRTQNRELLFKCRTYNMHSLSNPLILMMFSRQAISGSDDMKIRHIVAIVIILIRSVPRIGR